MNEADRYRDMDAVFKFLGSVIMVGGIGWYLFDTFRPLFTGNW